MAGDARAGIGDKITTECGSPVSISSAWFHVDLEGDIRPFARDLFLSDAFSLRLRLGSEALGGVLHRGAGDLGPDGSDAQLKVNCARNLQTHLEGHGLVELPRRQGLVGAGNRQTFLEWPQAPIRSGPLSFSGWRQITAKVPGQESGGSAASLTGLLQRGIWEIRSISRVNRKGFATAARGCDLRQTPAREDSIKSSEGAGGSPPVRLPHTVDSGEAIHSLVAAILSATLQQHNREHVRAEGEKTSQGVPSPVCHCKPPQ